MITLLSRSALTLRPMSSGTGGVAVFRAAQLGSPVMCLGLDELLAMPPAGSAWKRSCLTDNPVSTCSSVSCAAGNRTHALGPSQRLGRRSYSALAVYVLLAIAFVLSTSASSWADVEPKRVLMLHSFGLRFKPWTDYAQIIRSEITRNAQRSVDFHDHSLLTARLNDDTSDGPFVDYLYALYTERPPDLIIAIGAPAANFVQRYRQRIFPGTPMLFTAVEARRVQYDKLTEDDTVVAVAHDFPASFENILRVLPRTKTIAIVNGTSPNETFWLGELRRETAPLAGRVELKFYNELSFEHILKDAANLPPDSAIFWHLMNVDAAGVAHEANAALSTLSATANAPIFSYLDNFFGDTTVGGPMHLVEEGSAVAAAVAIRILNGEKAGSIKTAPTRTQQRRNTIGGRCSAGESTRAVFRQGARFTSNRHDLGNLPLAVGHHLCGVSERAAPGRRCDRHAQWRCCHVSQGFLRHSSGHATDCELHQRVSCRRLFLVRSTQSRFISAKCGFPTATTRGRLMMG